MVGFPCCFGEWPGRHLNGSRRGIARLFRGLSAACNRARKASAKSGDQRMRSAGAMPEAQPAKRDQPLAQRLECAMFMTKLLRQRAPGLPLPTSEEDLRRRRESRCSAMLGAEVNKALTGRARREARRATHNRRPRSRRTGGRHRIAAALGDERLGQAAAHRDRSSTLQPLACGQPRQSSSRPSDTSIIAVACGGERLARFEQRNRPAVGVDQRPARRPDPRSNWARPAAESPSVPTSHSLSPGLRPARDGVAGSGAADRGQAEHARRAGRQGDRVAADQRQRRYAAHAASIPSMKPASPMRHRRSASATAGAAAGVAPLAARSDRLTATSFHPTLVGRVAGQDNARPRRCCRG